MDPTADIGVDHTVGRQLYSGPYVRTSQQWTLTAEKDTDMYVTLQAAVEWTI